ncbi:Fur family transcriptional regulator [Chryseobacterium lathyri]|uniref:Fur family ferric uptake transcriptional regulator n=1 Tax=Chryseobacterium lathyri TaxID=395933 RepID=A0ABT9SKB6_9FLAO|nr:transcriptional repressor [Chryseobacterium lathyri]MDP9959743.1 Fur family ferric uptake transcriptional regulator [Chryseobacterium lathyri]MDQ0064685.1 Fur family ferric uptake transcriptional regulator [Chryseobacterium lathyri]
MKQTRNTQAKTEILNVINHSDIALSQSDIQKKLGDLCNRVTIYRVLERLENEGLIHKIINIDGVVNFAKCSGKCNAGKHFHNHIHFNCKECHSVTCIENVVPDIRLPTDFIAQEYNFIVSGICPKCSKI